MIVQKKRREDQNISRDLHRAEVFPCDQYTHQACRQGIDDGQDGCLFGSYIFLSERLKGKSETAAQQNQEQHESPLPACLRHGKISRNKGGNQNNPGGKDNPGGGEGEDVSIVIDGETTSLASMEDVRCKMEDVWYTLDGRKLQGKPTVKGLYIHNGKTIMIKK